MLYTIILPEYLLGKALSGFMRARHLEKRKEATERKHDTTPNFPVAARLVDCVSHNVCWYWWFRG